MKSFKDPVCGMIVGEGEGISLSHEGTLYHFCSDFCRKTFLENPQGYAAHPSDEQHAKGDTSRHVAYFSMEVAADGPMPTYSGGLGVLAGDTLRSMADLKMPAVGVSLLYKNGYFDQRLDEWGNQYESPVTWDPSQFAHRLSNKIAVTIEGRNVVVGVWQHDIVGATGFIVPLLLLDTNLDENDPAARDLTAWLYGGDQRYRLAQEVILGIGGVRMLHALGYTELERFHMNEGHAALLALELLREGEDPSKGNWRFDQVRAKCVFTTHTPVPAGHDRFSYDLVRQVLGDPVPLELIQMLAGQEQLNMTLFALNTSHYVNGVAKKHGQVSREMFAGYPIDSITNGVHSATWTCDSFRKLYDRHIPGWINDPFALRYAISIPKEEIWDAHLAAKANLIGEVNRRAHAAFSNQAFTIGFARRATLYKRAGLLFADAVQLLQIAQRVGPIQVVFAGKAHPQDDGGKGVIRHILEMARQPGGAVRVAYLENYDMALGLLLTAGTDLWLNTPLRPLEASGTSGMKAAHNGVPSFSVLDGWWIEGHIEGVTGWSIGPRSSDPSQPSEASWREDSEDLYRKLRAEIAPMFYGRRDRWIDVMRQTIAFNASFFNTQRMVQQYAANAYV